jgi:hypothetical protein
MTMLHVMPDSRGGWSVVDDDARTPLSHHPSATHAEAAARLLAAARGAEGILVHDRYHRLRRAPVPHGSRPSRFTHA